MTQEYKELLIGCGNSRAKRFDTLETKDWKGLVTLDMDETCQPDIVHNLNKLGYPFQDNEFDSIHAYDVLEHCGSQGDFRFFFAQFTELWRILKPNGLLCATVPKWDKLWALADPGHTRIINHGTLAFLSQLSYKNQIGKTQMTDYRCIYKSDFRVTLSEYTNDDSFIFILKAIK